MMFYFHSYVFLVLFVPVILAFKDKVHYMEPESNYQCCKGFKSEQPEIYCYAGIEKHIVHIWETVQLHLSLGTGDFEQFDGSSPEEVLNKFENRRSSWNFNFYTTKKKAIKLNPFNNTCIGIVSGGDYNVKLSRIRVDYWRILTFLVGFAIFFAAPKISGNSLFYYLCGISIGTCSSVLILVFILSRLIPKKPAMYTFLAGGWTVGIYMVQLLWDNIRTIATSYQTYILYYLATTSILSFVICYRMGPVSDPKSINLITWALQAFGLIFILLSSDFQEATLAFIILLLSAYCLPFGYVFRFLSKVTKWWSYPEKRRLLSEDEFHEQGVIETRKALDSLRGYCSSPECNQWRTVLKLKDPLSLKNRDALKKFESMRPKKRITSSPLSIPAKGNRQITSYRRWKEKSGEFAQFVEGSSHLVDDEVLAFETDPRLVDLLTDDSESSSD